MRAKGVGSAIAIVLMLLTPSLSSGQPRGEGAWRIGGFAGAALGADGSAATFGGAVSFPLLSRLSLEGEVAHVSDLDCGEFPVCPPGLMCFRGGSFDLHRKTTTFAASVVGHLPVSYRRVTPYVAAGGGVARVTREVRDPLAPSERTVTGPIVSAGGGMDVRLGPAVVAGIDARYQRVLGEGPRLRRDIPDSFGWLRLAASMGLTF